jgi:hypothetical protein
MSRSPRDSRGTAGCPRPLITIERVRLEAIVSPVGERPTPSAPHRVAQGRQGRCPHTPGALAASCNRNAPQYDTARCASRERAPCAGVTPTGIVGAAQVPGAAPSRPDHRRPRRPIAVTQEGSSSHETRSHHRPSRGARLRARRGRLQQQQLHTGTRRITRRSGGVGHDLRPGRFQPANVSSMNGRSDAPAVRLVLGMAC